LQNYFYHYFFGLMQQLFFGFFPQIVKMKPLWRRIKCAFRAFWELKDAAFWSLSIISNILAERIVEYIHLEQTPYLPNTGLRVRAFDNFKTNKCLSNLDILIILNKTGKCWALAMVHMIVFYIISSSFTLSNLIPFSSKLFFDQCSKLDGKVYNYFLLHKDCNFW